MKLTNTLLTAAIFSFSVLGAAQVVYANVNDDVLQQSVLSGGEQLAQGSSAFMNEEYETAFKLLKPLAEKGNALAQYLLGVMYVEDSIKGIKQDDIEAFKWYHKAAEQGVAKAQFDLGNMYYNGEGVKQDYVEAAKWYRKAAEQGEVEAQLNLGFMYDSGNGVQQDHAEARKWYLEAAGQGGTSSTIKFRFDV